MLSDPRPARRTALKGFVALLAAIFAIGLATIVPVVAAPAVPGPGFTDFVYKPDVDGTGGDDVTSFRNQSKLWFNDGKWWGILFDKGTSPNGTYRIQSFNMATQAWTTGATATQVDNRNRSNADALWDGTNLWVVSSHVHGRNWAPNGDLRIYKYTYSSVTKTYAIVSGFPKTLFTNGPDPDPVNKVIAAPDGTFAATIAKAPNGLLWIAYRYATSIKFLHSTTSGGTVWTTPIDVPGLGNPVTTNDMAAITNVGTNGVGVLWSNQTAGDEAFYFAAHKDGDADGTWTARETAFGGAGTLSADGHISLKTDAGGRVIAAIKTSRVSLAAPLIDVIARTGNADVAGTWTNRIVSSVTQKGTRPVLVLDSENSQANVLITDVSTVGAQLITRRVAPLASLDFGAAAIGTPFIDSSTAGSINNATSTKQVTTVASGILALAADITSRTYLHGCAGSVCPVTPVADFTGTPLTGVAPLNVQFTDASTGTPATWAWTFGDGGTSTLQNPIHTYNPGTYDVSLTVTNVAGTNAKTRTGYVVVSVPPGASYTAITPTRVLDTRDGTGLSGVFNAGTARDFQVTNGGTIPNTAIAVTGNLTVTQQTSAGYIILAPTAGSATSTINFPKGDNRANGVTVALSGTGQLNAVYKAASGTVHLIFDVTGYFENGGGGASYFPITPTRVLDTRDGTGLSGTFNQGVARDFPVTNGGTIPSNAVAVTGNLTVTQQTRAGYIILAPAAGTTTSTINFPIGDNRANGVTVALGAGGKLNAVYKASSGTVHLIFDVTGYFVAGSSGKNYFPLAPNRVLDTRNGTGLSGVFNQGTPRDFLVADGTTIPNTAVAVTGNLTVTQQTRAGYIILAPIAGTTTSTINFPIGDNRANGVTVALSGTGKLDAVYKASSGTTHLLFDVTGYFK
jgi:PKD repeat protein